MDNKVWLEHWSRKPGVESSKLSRVWLNISFLFYFAQFIKEDKTTESLPSPRNLDQLLGQAQQLSIIK